MPHRVFRLVRVLLSVSALASGLLAVASARAGEQPRPVGAIAAALGSGGAIAAALGPGAVSSPKPVAAQPAVLSPLPSPSAVNQPSPVPVVPVVPVVPTPVASPLPTAAPAASPIPSVAPTPPPPAATNPQTSSASLGPGPALIIAVLGVCLIAAGFLLRQRSKS